jgi:prephenate dehydrogenase
VGGLRFHRFGIVGYGHFGAFMARSLARHGTVLVSDVGAVAVPPRRRLGSGRVRAAELAEVATCELVLVAVPFAALEPVLTAIRPALHPESVVMEVVSTKVASTELLTGVLAGHANLLATHPLFGPPSMKGMGRGQRLVVTHEQGPRARAFLAFLERRYGVTLHAMSAEEHDRAMAYMQALPFFVARALVGLDYLELEHRRALSFPSFEKLAALAAIEEHHTDAMFDTSQRSNPFAAAARHQLIEVLTKLNAEIGAGHVEFRTHVHADPGTLAAELPPAGP